MSSAEQVFFFIFFFYFYGESDFNPIIFLSTGTLHG